MRARHLAVPILLSLCGAAAAQDSGIYIELLWSRPRLTRLPASRPGSSS
jgi:hypothetical protein